MAGKKDLRLRQAISKKVRIVEIIFRSEGSLDLALKGSQGVPVNIFLNNF